MAKKLSLEARRQMIVRKYQVVCKCNHITYGTIAQKISIGLQDIDSLAECLGVTCGACQGERCIPVLEDMLAQLLEE